MKLNEVEVKNWVEFRERKQKKKKHRKCPECEREAPLYWLIDPIKETGMRMCGECHTKAYNRLRGAGDKHSLLSP